MADTGNPPAASTLSKVEKLIGIATAKFTAWPAFQSSIVKDRVEGYTIHVSSYGEQKIATVQKGILTEQANPSEDTESLGMLSK
jgi:hypothetical protein